MNVRRVLISLVIVLGLAGSVGLSRSKADDTQVARFGFTPTVSRPYASHRTPINTTWYCPGVPAGDETVGGEVVIANQTDVPLLGSITLVGSDGVVPFTERIDVPARSTLDYDIDAQMTARFVSAFVEIEGGEAVVEQRAQTPAGDAVASCTTQTSDTWYFADGFTIDNSVEQLIITNPTADSVNVNLTVVTKSGQREPPNFQGRPVGPRSVLVISVADDGFVDEGILAVQITTTGGRLLVARAQEYKGGGRAGFTLNLGSPVLSAQVWFAMGAKEGNEISEQYVIYNPTQQDVVVDVTMLGFASETFVEPDPIPVAGGAVVTFDIGSVAGLPDGLHSVVFATLAQEAIVVERVLTEPAGDGFATSVVLGMTPEYVVTRWFVPIGVDEPTEDALVVQNVDFSDATVVVKAVGPGGAVPVPGLEAVPLRGSSTILISLTDPSVAGRPLIVESTQRIFVERRLPRGPDLDGRSGSWAMPECGQCNFLSPSP